MLILLITGIVQVVIIVRSSVIIPNLDVGI